MSGKERGVIQLIWKSFSASLKPNLLKRKLIGEDFYGTKYYEEAVSSRSARKKPHRYFVPVNKDDHEQEMPAEWESWLRFRREEPPTREEVEKNYQLAMTKKQNAREIEAMYSTTKVEPAQQLSSKEKTQSFPSYEEYKNFGQDYKIKKR